MAYQPAPNIELDFLNFDNVESIASICFYQTPTFQDPNAALNDMFKTGLTPLGSPNGALNTTAQYNSWINLESLNKPQSYFPEIVPPENFAPSASSVVESPESISQATPSAASEASEMLAKPKRGRPRKSRAKKQLSAQQEYEKRQKFLERNRHAASKCRERKKTWVSKQDEKLKQGQAKNAELKAQCNILHQEIHNILYILCQHAENGCNKDELHAFLKSEPILHLGSLNGPGQLVHRLSDTLMSSTGHESIQNSPTTRS